MQQRVVCSVEGVPGMWCGTCGSEELQLHERCPVSLLRGTSCGIGNTKCGVCVVCVCMVVVGGDGRS